jgi:hypothetical protein
VRERCHGTFSVRRLDGQSFTQLPVQWIEQSVKPTLEQQDRFEKLKAASTDAANLLQASCPTAMPQAPIDRFDAVGKRLDAMAAAIKTVRPALASFYASLTDEQKARFNTLGPPKTPSSRQAKDYRYVASVTNLLFAIGRHTPLAGPFQQRCRLRAQAAPHCRPARQPWPDPLAAPD